MELDKKESKVSIKDFEKDNFGKTTLSIRVTDKEIFDNTHLFKDHRSYIEWRFIQEHKMRVEQHGHIYESDDKVKKWGLVYEMEDSVIQTIVKITGVVGGSLREHTWDKPSTEG